MHILVVHQYFLGKDDAGGSRWNQFARYWAQAGQKVTILAGSVHYATGVKKDRYKGKFIVTEHLGENITVKRCHVSQAYNKNFIGRAWAYLSFAFSSSIAGVRTPKPDVIICTSPPLTVGLTGVILGRLKRTPMVFEVRDLWPESAIDTGILKSPMMQKMGFWLEKFSYRHARWINVLTPAFRDALVTRKGIPENKISVISNGADLDIIRPASHNDPGLRRRLGLEGKFIVMYVGAHGVANALAQLLDSAQIFKSEAPQVQIVLVGDGMEKPALVESAGQRGLDNVTFIDSVPKETINEYITSADVCVAVLKKCDTFKTVYPNKVFDYMAAAKPVVIAIDGAARQLVEQAQAGLFAEPENPSDFVRAVLYLKDNPETAAAFGRKGLEYVRNNFSRQVLAQRYLQVLIDIVGRKD